MNISENAAQPETRSLDREGLIKAVQDLHLPAGEYAVFGSGLLVVRGLRNTEDIDLIVSEDAYMSLKRAGWEEQRWGEESYLTSGIFEAIPSLNYPGFAPDTRELIARAELIEGVPFVCREDILAWKAARNKPKDREDIASLERLGC